MEGSGHLGPEKSGFKVPKNPAKTPIANGQLLMHGDRMQGEFEFDMRSATAHGTLIAQNTKS